MAGIYALVNLLFIVGLVTGQRRSTSTTTTTTTKTTTTEKNYVFEGVDYDLLPKDIIAYENDCDGQHHKCIRARTIFHPICAFIYSFYHPLSGYYQDFYSPCELELYNCKYREENKFGIFGTDYTNDAAFYNGEGLNCIYYRRRSKNSEQMDILYFGENPPPYRSLPIPE